MEVGEARLVAAGLIAPRALDPPPPVLLARAALDEVRVVTAWLAGREGRAATIDTGRLGRAAAWAAVLARVTPGPLFAAPGPDDSQAERSPRLCVSASRALR